MIFAFSTDDKTLMIFATEAEATAMAEGVDVEDGVWLFFDEEGMPLEAAFDTPNERNAIFVASGTYSLRPSQGAGLEEYLGQVASVEGSSRLNTVATVQEWLTSTRRNKKRQQDALTPPLGNFKFSLYVRILNRLPKGFWAGLVFGLLAFVLSALAFSMTYFVLRPFVWAAIYGEPYVSIPGPFPSQSGEWLFVQLIWFLSGVAFGFTVSFLSGHHKRLVFLSLAIVWSVLSFASEPIVDGWRFILSYAQVPIGFSLGYLIWRVRHSENTLHLYQNT